MTLAAFYEQVNGDLGDVRRRLVADERVEKFVRIFAADETFSVLERAFSEGSSEPAFRAAHTLKGMGRDMGFTALADRASELTEALRADDAGNYGSLEDAAELYEQVSDAYGAIVAALPLLDA